MKPSERALGQVFLVLELCHDRTKTNGGVTLIASIPGREGTYTQSWEAPYGVLEEGQVIDLGARASALIMDGVISWSGSQQVLGL